MPITREGAKVAKLGLLAGLIIALATVLSPANENHVRAQEQPKPADNEPVFTKEELAGWADYLHGDTQTAYDKITAILISPHKDTSADRVLLALQRNLAIEQGNDVGHSRDLQKIIEAAPDSGDLDAKKFELSQSLRRVGTSMDADKFASDLGYITNWWVCGPFLNERGQGFEEVLEPEKQISLDSHYIGKDGQACRYHKLPVQPIDGLVDLSAMQRPNSEAVAYLLAAVHVEKNKWCYLRVGSSSPIRGWLPDSASRLGKPVIDNDVEREIGFDQASSSYRQDGTSSYLLTVGWNLVLIKTAAGENSWKFRARFTTGSDLRFAQTEEHLKEALAQTSERKELSSVVAIDSPPSSRKRLIAALSELFVPREDRSSNTTRAELEKLWKQPHGHFESDGRWVEGPKPDYYPILTFLLAEASKSKVREASGREENKRRELLEKVLELDPKAARAALELAKYYAATFRNPTEADRYAQMAVKLAPKWVEARVFAARVAAMRGLDGEIERELHALLQEFPDHPSVLKFAGYYRGLRGDYKGSDELFKRCLYKGDYTDSYCRERLFSRAVERLDTSAATEFANQTRSLNPFDLDTSTGLIKLHLANGNNHSALAECERALNICPREDNFLASKGEIYLRMADKAGDEKFGETRAEFRKKAIEAYREALKCNPNRSDIARYLEFIADEKPKWEVKLQENIEERLLAALKMPVDGNDPYRVVYKDDITVVNEDGTKSIYSQYAYRVCNDDGRELLQSLGAPAYEDQIGRCVGARVYHPDGSSEEGRRIDSRAEFPPLSVGDIVTLRFRISDTQQGFFGDFFGAYETLADYVPVDEVRLVYVLPKSRKFYEYRTNGAAAPSVREDDGCAIWTYSAKGLAKTQREPMSPKLDQTSPGIQISTYENWKEWGKWYHNLIRKQLEPTPEMRAKVAELIKDKTSERDKARAIYTWVVTAVRYNADWHFGVHGYKPFSAGAIFERCIGDCKDKSILMCTMLGIAGLKAYPVIINLEENRGREDITLPMPHHFNHAIACIEYADGTRQFVDGTATYNGFDEIPGADAGANVIIIKPEGGERTVIPVPPAEKNAEKISATLEFIGEGKVRLKVNRTACGDRASYLRANFLREGDRARIIEGEWARHKAGVKVSDIKANDLSDINVAPELTYTLEIPDAYAIDAKGNLEMDIALDPLLFGKGIVSASTRRTDIVFGTPYLWESELTVSIPRGMKTGDLLKSYLFDSATLGRFCTLVEVIDRTVSISRTYVNRGGVVAAKDYPQLREEMLNYDRAEAAKLKLVKE